MDINQIINSLNKLHYQMEQNPKEYIESTKLRETIRKFYHLERKTKKLKQIPKTSMSSSKVAVAPTSDNGIRKLRYRRAVNLRKAYEAKSPLTLTESANNEAIYTSKGICKMSDKTQTFKCYICKASTNKPHHFYDQLCEACGNFNYEKRLQTCNLLGKVAIVTGGRIKIGFETALKLLRAGSTVIITTRFPADALKRYSNEPDYEDWRTRLEILHLDLRHFSGIVEFCKHVRMKYNKIDVLIQNAAQTIWRPLPFYEKLISGETTNSVQDSNSIQTKTPSDKVAPNLQFNHAEDILYGESLELIKAHFPKNIYDEHQQPLDLRPKNSWTLEIEQIQPIELVETHLINYISPFLLLQQLLPALSTGTEMTYVIMVSSMEGAFNRTFKTSQHVHTNSAKASLNMIVRTCSDYLYSKYKICMNAVDTGWVTDERPSATEAEYKEKPTCPLDEIDGASRILDPIYQSINNSADEGMFGLFLKDYKSILW